MRAFAIALLCGLSLGTSLCFAQTAKPLTVCADPDPPPFTYWKRDANGQKRAEFTGSSVDTLRAVFAHLGRAVEFNGEYPWARCLLMVETGQIDFAMDAYYDADRAKRFAYTTHYNTLTPQVFFLASRPVRVKALADLKKYRGCGMIGASYAHYGLGPKELDLGVGYESLIKKLKAQRCDYFVEETEIFAGYRLAGTDYLSDPQIRHAPVPGATAPAKHLITAKDSEAAKLIPAINAALKSLTQSGEAAAFWKKHAGELPYKP